MRSVAAAVVLLALLCVQGCGREVSTEKTKADGAIQGLHMDAKSAALLGTWLQHAYHLGRAGVRKASVDYHTILDQDYYREPMESRGRFDYVEGAAVPEWNPAAPKALLTRWLDPSSFRKDYATAVFTAREQPDGLVRVSVSGSPATNVRAFVFDADGSLVQQEILVWTRKRPRPTAVVKTTFEQQAGKLVLAQRTGTCELPEVGPGQDEVTLTYAEHGGYLVPVTYEARISSGRYYWSWRMELENWKLNEEIAD